MHPTMRRMRRQSRKRRPLISKFARELAASLVTGRKKSSEDYYYDKKKRLRKTNLEHITRALAQSQTPTCSCCGEQPTTIFESIAMIFTHHDASLCDICWKIKGSDGKGGTKAWLFYNNPENNRWKSYRRDEKDEDDK